jgi:dTDP-4-amino-4,6-dideoxygalactose transaminase
MININEVILPDRKKLFKLFNKVYKSGKITNNGYYVQKFEQQLKSKLESDFALTTSNGTLGLQLALRTIPQKGEIITTPLSFIASVSSIIWEGFTPVFCDIDSETLCIDHTLVKEKINPNTVGILGVHLFGNLCEINFLENLCNDYNLKLIFDASHSFGCRYYDKSCFNFNSISVMSLHAYKVVSSIEGGVIFLNDKSDYERLHKMRYFGN